MSEQYDIFERFPDGKVMWRGVVPGLGNAKQKLDELAKSSKNEFHAMDTPNKEIVARVNEAGGVESMIGEIEERWRELCKQATVEQDAQKIAALIEDIKRLLAVQTGSHQKRNSHPMSLQTGPTP